MRATQTFKGRDGEYRFDYGGHRFITKNPELLAFIDELMGTICPRRAQERDPLWRAHL